jgi:hypothetical protein
MRRWAEIVEGDTVWVVTCEWVKILELRRYGEIVYSLDSGSPTVHHHAIGELVSIQLEEENG